MATHHTATHRNTLQHTATHRNTLPPCAFYHLLSELKHYGTPWHHNTLQHNETHPTTLNSLQYTSTHCNTLHHTSMPCNTLKPLTTIHCNTIHRTKSTMIHNELQYTFEYASHSIPASVPHVLSKQRIPTIFYDRKNLGVASMWPRLVLGLMCLCVCVWCACVWHLKSTAGCRELVRMCVWVGSG